MYKTEINIQPKSRFLLLGGRLMLAWASLVMPLTPVIGYAQVFPGDAPTREQVQDGVASKNRTTPQARNSSIVARPRS